jgi:hypothetical protein
MNNIGGIEGAVRNGQSRDTNNIGGIEGAVRNGQSRDTNNIGGIERAVRNGQSRETGNGVCYTNLWFLVLAHIETTDQM